MSFIINNVLTAEGSKKDIQRFIETFTAEKLESLCMLDYFEVEKSEPDTCTIVYSTRRNLFLNEVISILANFRDLVFHISYGNCYLSFIGDITIFGGIVVTHNRIPITDSE